MIKLILILSIPTCVIVYYCASYIFGYHVFYGLLSDKLAFLIGHYPGALFIPVELSLDSIVALSNRLGELLGIIAACFLAFIFGATWEKVRSSRKQDSKSAEGSGQAAGRNE